MTSKQKRGALISCAILALGVGGAMVGFAQTKPKSEYHEDWAPNGRFDPSLVPDRIRVVTGPETYGYVAKEVYPAFRLQRDINKAWPVYDSSSGGTIIGVLYSDIGGVYPEGTSRADAIRLASEQGLRSETQAAPPKSVPMATP